MGSDEIEHDGTNFVPAEGGAHVRGEEELALRQLVVVEGDTGGSHFSDETEAQQQWGSWWRRRRMSEQGEADADKVDCPATEPQGFKASRFFQAVDEDTARVLCSPPPGSLKDY